ncbi:MAG TPA: hypothetical protein DHW82_09660 [Spirochaetia bacterium]|nr:MAG: hypothetical protein A2Y41_00495 [Spirochaetes bacterium GWB1_36_13]HCL57257.1 hypothetical protein [Spirochaetia bacterium]
MTLKKNIMVRMSEENKRQIAYLTSQAVNVSQLMRNAIETKYLEMREKELAKARIEAKFQELKKQKEETV